MEPDPTPPPAYRRAGRILLIVLVLYGVLVATNEGEFWPFSIYPMFSQAGRPWARAVVREMPDGATWSWESREVEALPGDPVALIPRGVDAIDLANFVNKTERWTPERIAALRTVLRLDSARSPQMMVMSARGQLLGEGVEVDFTPYLVFTPDSAYLNPELSR